MAIETVHTGSKVVDAVTELGDLLIHVVSSKRRRRADDLCAHAASSHDKSVLDERRDGSLDRHVGNIKPFRERFDRRQFSADGEPAADDLGVNGGCHARISRNGCLSRICHTSTLPK